MTKHLPDWLKAGRNWNAAISLSLIDDAYPAKYKGSPYLKPMIGARARSATVKLMPHATKA